MRSTMQAATAGRVILAGLLFTSFSACRDSTAPALNAHSAAPPARFEKVAASRSESHRKIPDEYIVVFDETVSDVRGRSETLASIAGGQIRFTFSSAIRGFAASMSPQAAEALSRHPGVRYVEQDQEVSMAEVQSGATWGLDRIDQSLLPLDGKFSYNGNGSGVNVYIIDTGIRTSHSQFGGRARASFSSINDTYGAQGCHWHGTHVAGTAGGSTAGVAKGATLHSVRVLDCSGSGTVSGVVAGVDWVAANKTLPAVANLSISGDLSVALNEAVQRLVAANVPVVVAAGNAAGDACGYSPASASGALTVGATTSADGMAWFSNWGTCIDLFAPGATITSAMSSDDYAMGPASGTSMATPHVAGAAAIYLQAHPGASPAEVASALVGGATRGVVIGAQTSPNLLLHVNGEGGTVTTPPPTVAPPPPSDSPPTAVFAASCRKSECRFDASTSTDDKGIASYRWNFGDGSSGASAASPIANHVYSGRGNYSVTVVLTVTDTGGLSSSVSRTLQIKSGGK